MLLQIPNHFYSNCSTCSDNLCAFRLLKMTELLSCGGHCYWAYFEAGEKVVPRDISKEYIIFLRKGTVKQLNLDDYLVQIVQNGAYLNLNQIFNNNNFSFKAITAVNVCFIERKTFNHFLKNNTQFAFEVIRSEQQKEKNYFASFCQLSNKNTVEKIAIVLLNFSRLIYKSKVFKLHLRRKEFAQMLGVGRETISKGLSKLSQKGVIEVDGKNIKIIQIEELNKIAGLD